MKRSIIACFLSAVLGGVVATWLLDPNAHWPVTPAANAQVSPSVGTAGVTSPRIAAASTRTAIAPTQLTPEELTNIRVYEVANRGVVNINTKFESYERLFGFQVAMPGEGSGSGAVIDHQGHILTNFHVVESSSEIQVTLAGG